MLCVKQAGADIIPRGEELSRLPFLRTWFRTRSAIVMHLSNGTLQVSCYLDHLLHLFIFIICSYQWMHISKTLGILHWLQSNQIMISYIVILQHMVCLKRDNQVTSGPILGHLFFSSKFLRFFAAFIVDWENWLCSISCIPGIFWWSVNKLNGIEDWSESFWDRRPNVHAFCLQINFFQDHTKIILCPLMSAVTYIDETRANHTYRFSLIEELGCCKELASRLRYARTMVERLMSSKSGSSRGKSVVSWATGSSLYRTDYSIIPWLYARFFCMCGFCMTKCDLWLCMWVPRPMCCLEPMPSSAGVQAVKALIICEAELSLVPFFKGCFPC